MIMIVTVLSDFRQYSEYSTSYQPEVAMANLLYKSPDKENHLSHHSENWPYLVPPSCNLHGDLHHLEAVLILLSVESSITMTCWEGWRETEGLQKNKTAVKLSALSQCSQVGVILLPRHAPPPHIHTQTHTQHYAVYLRRCKHVSPEASPATFLWVNGHNYSVGVRSSWVLSLSRHGFLTNECVFLSLNYC